MNPTVRWMAFGAMGFELAVITIMGLYLGMKLDDWWSLEPLGVLLGVILGMSAGLIRLVMNLRFLDRQAARGKEDKRP